MSDVPVSAPQDAAPARSEETDEALADEARDAAYRRGLSEARSRSVLAPRNPRVLADQKAHHVLLARLSSLRARAEEAERERDLMRRAMEDANVGQWPTHRDGKRLCPSRAHFWGNCQCSGRPNLDALRQMGSPEVDIARAERDVQEVRAESAERERDALAEALRAIRDHVFADLPEEESLPRNRLQWIAAHVYLTLSSGGATPGKRNALR